MHQEGNYQPKITREIHHQSTVQIPDEGSREISCTVDLSNTGSTSSMDTRKAISTSNRCRNKIPLCRKQDSKHQRLMVFHGTWRKMLLRKDRIYTIAS
uniref:Uncharacterized protein n=1 Tax=Brassica oleracea TaxID=3712 RepID=A0A3P6DZR2_BRAOL|nr:unnamed protein product [Brassica oleracea]